MLWSLPRQTSSDQRMISLNSEWTWNVRQNTRQITVPESLLLDYKQRVGLDGVIVWIYLQLLSHTLQQGEAVDVLSWLQDQLEWDSFRVQQGFCLLVENNLVSVEGQTCTLLYPQEAPGDGDGTGSPRLSLGGCGAGRTSRRAPAPDQFRGPEAGGLRRLTWPRWWMSMKNV